MMIADAIELAVIRGADRALRRAAARASMRASQATDGSIRAKHERDAAAWAGCADDVAALKGPRAPDDEPPEPAPVGPAPDSPTSGGAAAAVPATGQRECA